ncbi:MAG: DEAD/DEAH box helicase [Muribaculaceae bacterium]|nr:DEAD/DEAH box helicase [Muribaculaceae bacterium]
MKEKELIESIQQKFGISELNKMQKEMLASSSQKRDIILLSPTGTGKTLAFTLPVLKMMKPASGRIQCVVIAPSRELVIQIAGVLREASKAFRTVALYGGHKVEDEVNSLKVIPDIVVSTPGRLLDHSVRHNLELLPVRILVLDEFDKTLELGFEEEMKKLLKRMKNVSRTILTSATKADTLPEFLNLDNPLVIDNTTDIEDVRDRMNIRRVKSSATDKLESLLVLLHNINHGKESMEKTIVFSNHRESAERIYEFLKKQHVSCSLYHGALEQKDREIAIAMFNNGTTPVLVATDLAARGLDIENVNSVIHYHQPLTQESFVHRNGRTARVDREGDIYILTGPDEELKEFFSVDDIYDLDVDKKTNLSSNFATLYISAGKKEKISRGDILGFLVKECNVPASEIGRIDVSDHYSLARVPQDKVKDILKNGETKKMKGEKRKIKAFAK